MRGERAVNLSECRARHLRGQTMPSAGGMKIMQTWMTDAR
jgi:hypothetical protein